jgi:predicted acetyltransferase
MKELKLILPTSADEQEVWGYRKEFLEQGSSLDGSGGLAEAESFAQWYSKTLANRSEQTVCPGLVPATTFLAVDADGKLIGMIDIRHRLNEGLLRFGGNIGYSVRPCCRRQGYATQMLALALEECRKMQMQEVLVTCNKENIGSAKTIQKNGGVFKTSPCKNIFCTGLFDDEAYIIKKNLLWKAGCTDFVFHRFSENEKTLRSFDRSVFVRGADSRT